MTAETRHILNLCRRLTKICLEMDRAQDAETRHQLADEAERICKQLNLPVPDRNLIGKPVIYAQLEV